MEAQAADMRSDLQQFSMAGADKSQARTGRTPKNPSRWRRLLYDTTGNAITEFGLVLPIFLVMVCGITDMSRLLYQQTTTALQTRVLL